MDIIGIFATLGGIVTAIIGGVGLYQASRIKKVSEQMALFENRFNVYLEMEDIMISSLQRNETSDLHNRIKRIKPKIVFLFGQDIHEYLTKISNAISVTNDDNGAWMIEQIQGKCLREKFNRYLDLSTYGVKI